MKELLRKTYTLEVELKGGEVVLFEIKQGSLREIIEMSQAIGAIGSLKTWLVGFLLARKPEGLNIDASDFEFLMPERVLEIVDWLTRTYAKGFFKKSKKRAKIAGEDQQEEEAKAPQSALICFLLKETNESLESLLDLTWEQIDFLLEGSMWNQNAQTKEGQKRNERRARLKAGQAEWDNESAKDAIAKMEARIAEKNL